MIKITLGTLKDILQGECNTAFEAHIDDTFEGVSIDTRTLNEKNLFVPFLGENVDGHKFIDMAFEKGASVSLSESREYLSLDKPILVVEDGLVALQRLSQWYLKHVGAKVIAITGSNGKTTTKDMVECLLKPYFKVQKTIGNFNNEIGLPLTLLQLRETTEISILEMGMDKLHDIEFLSKMVTPDVAVITNVGESHIEKLGSRENIAKAKYEIVEGLKDGAALITSADYPLLKALMRGATNYRTVTAGIGEDNDYVITEIHESDNGTRFTLSNVASDIVIPQLGVHNASNASLALLVCKELGLDPKDTHQHFKDLEITEMRMQQIKLETGALVINDAYNASPSSMKSALSSLVGLNYKVKVVILGDILELGSYSESLHRSVGEFIEGLNAHIDLVITYGKEAKYISDAIQSIETLHFEKDEFENIHSAIEKHLNSDTAILLKGSRGMQLERLLEDIN